MTDSLIIILSAVFLVGFNKIENDKIEWNSQTKLTWNDFKGKADISSEHSAKTFVQVVEEVREQHKDSIIVYITTYFIKNLSWTKEQSQNLLNHEQLHFDIAEISARKIRRDYSNYKSFDIESTRLDLTKIYRKYFWNELDSLNFAYDEETEHGTIADKQKEWEIKIAKELKALEAYSSPRVVIKRYGK